MSIASPQVVSSGAEAAAADAKQSQSGTILYMNFQSGIMVDSVVHLYAVHTSTLEQFFTIVGKWLVMKFQTDPKAIFETYLPED